MNRINSGLPLRLGNGDNSPLEYDGRIGLEKCVVDPDAVFNSYRRG